MLPEKFTRLLVETEETAEIDRRRDYPEDDLVPLVRVADALRIGE